MAGTRSPCGATVFKTKVLHFKIEKKTIKDTNGNKKFKRMLSFLFEDKRKPFFTKFSFEEFNLVFFTEERLACFELTKAAKFLKKCAVIWNLFYGEFCHVLSRFNLHERIHDPFSVRSNSSVFFIHNINSKHDRETTDRELFRNSSDDLLAFLELKLKCCLKWIVIHFLIHCLPCKNFAVCYSFLITIALNTA